ncbi:erythromycin resistance leader peptide [Pedobacter jejuensis]|uniref:Uncharacterized protein n=1 Tax=Pedobacter jejuensis TaxID=1268550 RepID=A0A3N0C1J4_9SPHI|nr:hypothetical protein D7004_02075 [Pedobacter jejuensis]
MFIINKDRYQPNLY